MATSPVRYRYIGDGSASLSNIPAGDITDADWDKLTEEQRAAVAAHCDASPDAAAAQLYEEESESSKRKAGG